MLLSISTQQRPEIGDYPDSGKVGAFPAEGNRRFIGQRADTGEQGLDDWLGEA